MAEDETAKDAPPGAPLPPEAILLEVWKLAREAARAGEVPVAALVCERPPEDGGEWRILGADRNRILEYRDPTAHAEILAIRAAAALRNSERLNDCVLVTTLEPCVMCAGAALLARLDAVYYFAVAESGLAMRDVLEMESVRHKPLNHRPDMLPVPAFERRASEALRDFFRNKRG